MAMTMIYHGKCWKFGDNICIDGDIMSTEFLEKRIFDPDVLSKHIFEKINSDMAGQVRPGDIIVAGKRFAHGNPHVLGFLGMKGAGLGLLTESIPRGAFRNAVFAGVPILPRCPDITTLVNAGDELEVDFKSGCVRDLSTGRLFQFEPLPDYFIEIVESGGALAHLAKKNGCPGQGQGAIL